MTEELSDTKTVRRDIKVALLYEVSTLLSKSGRVFLFLQKLFGTMLMDQQKHLLKHQKNSVFFLDSSKMSVSHFPLNVMLLS